ncbi:MAG: polysaccharide export protein Wza [Bacteroidetes bacterium]|jgi:polysaccharide biosynthesis/export protein|nr:polysaccharide export protein Wza [Bacteroidota bacterium]
MRKYLIFFLLSEIMLFTSCAFHKITYVDDMVPYKNYPVTEQGEIKIQRDDRLSIVVSSKTPELAAPFNLGMGAYKIDNQGDISSSTLTSSQIREKGYTVNRDGDIDFPVLGKLHAEGLTQLEFSDVIKKTLIDKGLIKDPLVTVDLLNLKILMLGEVGSVGVLTLDDKRVTLLEAIAKTRGVTTNGRLEDVAVIRTENGVRKMYNVNLRAVSLFDSPVYYLQQNDIVYVQPKSGKPSQSFQNNWMLISTGFGTLSIVLSVLILLK